MPIKPGMEKRGVLPNDQRQGGNNQWGVEYRVKSFGPPFQPEQGNWQGDQASDHAQPEQIGKRREVCLQPAF